MTAIFVLLAACATTGVQHVAEFEQRIQSAKVVTSFQEVPPRALPDGKPLDFLLGDSMRDVAMKWEGEDTFIAIFELPAFQMPYSIDITSHKLGTLQSPAIFYPQYVMLDANFNERRRSNAKHFTYRSATRGVDGLSSTIFVNEENHEERYLAVVSLRRTNVETIDSLAQFSGQTSFTVPVKGGFLMWLIPVGGNEKPTPMKALAGGRLTISTTVYRPRQIGT